MSYLNPDVLGSARPYNLSLMDHNRSVIQIYNEIRMGATIPTSSDVIDLFYNDTLTGFYVLDWWVWMEQVDTGGTVAFNIGVAGDATGVSGTTGLRWESGVTTLGRVSGARHRATNANCLLISGHANRVGLQVSVPAAGPVWTGKRIGMGLTLAVAGSF